MNKHNLAVELNLLIEREANYISNMEGNIKRKIESLDSGMARLSKAIDNETTLEIIYQARDMLSIIEGLEDKLNLLVSMGSHCEALEKAKELTNQ